MARACPSGRFRVLLALTVALVLMSACQLVAPTPVAPARATPSASPSATAATPTPTSAPQATLAPATPSKIPTLSLDPWPSRFEAAQGDEQATAQVAAEFVAAQADLGEVELAARLRAQLAAAGWPAEITGATLRRLDAGLTLAQLPPMAIYLLEEGRATRLTDGELLLDARLSGEDLGVIYGVLGASGVQPGFGLWRRSPEGAWQERWTPRGRRDWVTTDGEIRFAGEGLERLLVTGSSFGLEDALWHECHACLHRTLSGAWRRQGDGYERETALPADAPLEDVWWEMTERTPYALLHEALRRLRQGLPADDLADQHAVGELRTLGLLAEEPILSPQQEVGDTLHFSDLTSGNGYVATIREGRVARVQQVRQ